MSVAEHCEQFDVDGEPVVVRVTEDWTDEDAEMFARIVRAARQHFRGSGDSQP